jgi:hypothetical protein
MDTLTDEEIERIMDSSLQKYKKYQRSGVRGMQLTIRDNYEFWVIQVTLELINQNRTKKTNETK